MRLSSTLSYSLTSSTAGKNKYHQQTTQPSWITAVNQSRHLHERRSTQDNNDSFSEQPQGKTRAEGFKYSTPLRRSFRENANSSMIDSFYNVRTESNLSEVQYSQKKQSSVMDMNCSLMDSPTKENEGFGYSGFISRSSNIKRPDDNLSASKGNFNLNVTRVASTNPSSTVSASAVVVSQRARASNSMYGSLMIINNDKESCNVTLATSSIHSKVAATQVDEFKLHSTLVSEFLQTAADKTPAILSEKDASGNIPERGYTNAQGTKNINQVNYMNINAYGTPIKEIIKKEININRTTSSVSKEIEQYKKDLTVFQSQIGDYQEKLRQVSHGGVSGYNRSEFKDVRNSMQPGSRYQVERVTPCIATTKPKENPFVINKDTSASRINETDLLKMIKIETVPTFKQQKQSQIEVCALKKPEEKKELLQKPQVNESMVNGYRRDKRSFTYSNHTMSILQKLDSAISTADKRISEFSSSSKPSLNLPQKNNLDQLVSQFNHETAETIIRGGQVKSQIILNDQHLMESTLEILSSKQTPRFKQECGIAYLSLSDMCEQSSQYDSNFSFREKSIDNNETFRCVI